MHIFAFFVEYWWAWWVVCMLFFFAVMINTESGEDGEVLPKEKQQSWLPLANVFTWVFAFVAVITTLSWFFGSGT